MHIRRFFLLALPLYVLTACVKGDFAAEQSSVSGDHDISGLAHGEIVIGERLDNPYSTENMRNAYSSLYPTRSRDVVETTHLYVRFLPENVEQLQLLEETGIVLYDYPLDYEIEVEGDYYMDPTLPEGSITWQYAVVEKDFDFPAVKHEVIEECCITEYDPETRSDGVDWDMIERESFRLTGNSEMLEPQTRAAKHLPKGRLTVSDSFTSASGCRGVSGVKVVANVFVKIARAYTDKDGYFTMDKTFRSKKVRYSIVFENKKKFSLGFNFVLVPASVSGLGRHSSDEIEMNFTMDKDPKTWRRSVVNNAFYDYYDMLCGDNSGVAVPPSNVRVWMFESMSDGLSLMMHHGAVWSSSVLGKIFPKIVPLLVMFSPDIVLGIKDYSSSSDLYERCWHELSHASHYSVVGNAFWDKYAVAAAANEVSGDIYGSGESKDDMYVGLAEMWAHYFANLLYNTVSGQENVPDDYWFKPRFLYDLEKHGLTASEIFALFAKDVKSIDGLGAKLLETYGDTYRGIFEEYFGEVDGLPEEDDDGPSVEYPQPWE